MNYTLLCYTIQYDIYSYIYITLRFYYIPYGLAIIFNYHFSIINIVRYGHHENKGFRLKAMNLQLALFSMTRAYFYYSFGTLFRNDYEERTMQMQHAPTK